MNHQALGRRLAASATTMTVGAVVYLCLQRLFEGLLDLRWMLVGCVVGAFVSTLLFYRAFEVGFKRASLIVFSTFLAISGFYVVGLLVDREYHLGLALGSGSTVFAWATLVTSWWVVPCVVGVLYLFDRVTWRGPRPSGPRAKPAAPEATDP